MAQPNEEPNHKSGSKRHRIQAAKSLRRLLKRDKKTVVPDHSSSSPATNEATVASGQPQPVHANIDENAPKSIVRPAEPTESPIPHSSRIAGAEPRSPPSTAISPTGTVAAQADGVPSTTSAETDVLQILPHRSGARNENHPAGNRPVDGSDSEPMPSKAYLQTDKTPIWTSAINDWKKTNPKEYAELGEIGDEPNINHLTLFQPAENTPAQVKARLKRWIPVLASVRGIVMPIAALDPHKVAPIICASIFFGIEVSIISMSIIL